MSLAKGTLMFMILLSYSLLLVSVTTNYWGIEGRDDVMTKINRGLWMECTQNAATKNVTACGKIVASKEPEWFNLVKALMLFATVSFLAVLVDAFIALSRKGQTLKKLGLLVSIPEVEVFIALLTYGSQTEMRLGWSFFVALGSLPLPILASTLAYVDGKQSEVAMKETAQKNEAIPGSSGEKPTEE